VAARRSDKIVLFEVDENPNAQKASDFLDLKEVAYIGINSEQDGVTEIAVIKDPVIVKELVRKVLDAPLRDNKDHSGPRYFMAFHFRDGTATARAYWLNSGQLFRRIMLPPEFATAARQALERAKTSR
jgi:hypothetical protein